MCQDGSIKKAKERFSKGKILAKYDRSIESKCSF